MHGLYKYLCRTSTKQIASKLTLIADPYLTTCVSPLTPESGPAGALSCPPPPGSRRAQRAWKWGRVTASSDALQWVITWEDGTSSIEKSNCLTLVRQPSRENPAPEGSNNNETAGAPERSVPIVPPNSFGPSPGGAAASNSLQAASVPSTFPDAGVCSQGCSVGIASLLTDLNAPEGSTPPSTITTQHHYAQRCCCCCCCCEQRQLLQAETQSSEQAPASYSEAPHYGSYS